MELHNFSEMMAMNSSRGKKCTRAAVSDTHLEEVTAKAEEIAAKEEEMIRSIKEGARLGEVDSKANYENMLNR